MDISDIIDILKNDGLFNFIIKKKKNLIAILYIYRHLFTIILQQFDRQFIHHL